MHHPRIYHGACLLGNKIYVVGGFRVKTCEQFALKSEKWSEICDFDEWGRGVTLMAVKSCYLMAIGGIDVFEYPDSERLRRLDVRRMDRGWQIFNLNGTPGICQAAFMLSESEFLICGGQDK